uniref:DUF1279 domain-containing protein n=1 Tax=Heterorhabditis bacteriophora TaxID=37862 RepID=A0A1I7XRX8_HETBA
MAFSCNYDGRPKKRQGAKNQRDERVSVFSGVDVIFLLETLHVPTLLVEKIKETPPTAGVFVIALLLYKIATPLRYATTLVIIQASFWTLRRMGKLRTVREVEYKVRTEYEKNKHLYGRKLYRYRNLGVRDVERKNSQGHVNVRKTNNNGLNGKHKKNY